MHFLILFVVKSVKYINKNKQIKLWLTQRTGQGCRKALFSQYCNCHSLHVVIRHRKHKWTWISTTNHVQNISCFIEHQFRTWSIMLMLSSENKLFYKHSVVEQKISSNELERRTWHPTVCGQFRKLSVKKKIIKKEKKSWAESNQVNAVKNPKWDIIELQHAWGAVLCLLLLGLRRKFKTMDACAFCPCTRGFLIHDTHYLWAVEFSHHVIF